LSLGRGNEALIQYPFARFIAANGFMVFAGWAVAASGALKGMPLLFGILWCYGYSISTGYAISGKEGARWMATYCGGYIVAGFVIYLLNEAFYRLG